MKDKYITTMIAACATFFASISATNQTNTDNVSSYDPKNYSFYQNSKMKIIEYSDEYRVNIRRPHLRWQKKKESRQKEQPPQPIVTIKNNMKSMYGKPIDIFLIHDTRITCNHWQIYKIKIHKNKAIVLPTTCLNQGHFWISNNIQIKKIFEYGYEPFYPFYFNKKTPITSFLQGNNIEGTFCRVDLGTIEEYNRNLELYAKSNHRAFSDVQKITKILNMILQIQSNTLLYHFTPRIQEQDRIDFQPYYTCQ